MSKLQIHVTGQPPQSLGPDRPEVSVGRAPTNDLAILDESLSRLHARFSLVGGVPMVEDLGSKNGTRVNGTRISGKQAIRAGDVIHFGNVKATVAADQASKVVIDYKDAPDLSRGTLFLSAEKLRSGLLGPPGQGSDRWPKALALLQEITLGLIRDVPPATLLEDLVEKLFGFLEAEHGVVLLRTEGAEVEPAVVRTRQGRASKADIRLSHTLVEAALDRREAILLRDPGLAPELSSKSLIMSGVTTAIVTPLEAEGSVIGLLYFDALFSRKPFDEDDLRLVTALAHVAAAKIQNAKLMEEVQKKRALEQEMAIARTIQQRLVPHGVPEGGAFQLHATLRPAKEVGGDLYDYFWEGGRLFFCIGDVSGKGVPAALVMAMTKTLFRANAAYLEDPARMMAAVSARLYEETDPTMFVTAFCGFLDLETGRLVYSNAGHDKPLRLRPGQPPAPLEAKSGLALGVFPDYAYARQEVVLEPGEGLLLYTDGVTEAVDPALELYGLPRLQAALGDLGPAPAEAAVDTLLASVDRFSRGAPQADDITVLCLRFLGSSRPTGTP
jgi:serine phosphatase RsbU (regulator of sigma subunit)